MAQPAASSQSVSELAEPLDNLASVFLDCSARLPHSEAFRYPADGGWRSLTWQDVEKRARELAAGLLDLGVHREDRVGIASSTRVEWVLADLGVILAGGATTSIYPNTMEDDVVYILSDAGAVVLIAEDAGQLAKVRERRSQLPDLSAVVVVDDEGVDRGDDGWVLSFADLAARGRARLQREPSCVDDAVAAIGPDSLSTLIYTSGTTGRPKGVELSHGAWVWLAEAVDEIEIILREDLQFLWLPLSHVFGKLLLAAQYRIGFATAVDGRIDAIVENLAVIRPTFMAAAPRIFEKVHARVNATAQEEGGPKARIFAWAIDIGVRAVRLEQAQQTVPLPLTLQRVLADRLVYSKIRARLGGRIVRLVSGSAALSPKVAEWFAAVGLPVLEGYGLTEAAGASFVNRPGALKIGTVGQPMPGVEVRIADDGEILVRSPGVTRGYRHLPEATAELLVGDGWLATGDVGEVDAQSYLKITDRKKDLVKTSGGKYIAPSAIEGALKAACPLLAHAIVVADGRRFASALLSLDPDTTRAWAEHRGLDVEACLQGTQPELRASVDKAVQEVNAGLNRWETIKVHKILPRELSVETGDLTPSLKVKRAAVGRHFRDVIDEIYAE
jgi:long-chain acyl-CoA synthetase